VAGASGYSAATTHVRGRVSRYRILEQLGEGGMGVVYLAYDETLSRNVALKLLSERLAGNSQFRDRFVRESRLAAAIDHPNIIPVFEAGEDDGRLFIAMRYVRGMNLGQMLAAEGALAPARAVAIVEQVGRALDAAHRESLVHRDVKPANVMIDAAEGREHCYLTDFGLTKNVGSSSGYTETGQFLGTLNYMAPEQIEGRAVDSRADLYALGCMLFECLAGVPPFVRDSDVATMYAHLREPVPSVCAARAGLPPAVDDVLARAMAKAPVDRHGSSAEMVTELRAALAGVQVASFRPSVAGTGRRFGRAAAAAVPPAASTAGAQAPPTWPAPPATAPPPVAAQPPQYQPPPPYQPLPPTTRLPPTPPRRGGDGERSYTRAAAIVAVAIILCAGGIAAALVLTKKDGGGRSAAAAKRVEPRLIQRTVVLRRELIRVTKVVRRAPSASGPGLRRRLRDDLQEARTLLRQSRAQQAATAAGAADLASANRKLGTVIEKLIRYTRHPQPVVIETVPTLLGDVGRDVNQARHAPLPDLPRTPTPPVAGMPARSVTIPDDAVAEIDAGPGGTISSIEDVGDLNGDEQHDLGVVASPPGGDGEPEAFVVFGGDRGQVDLNEIGAGSGFPVAAATGIAAAGDVDGDGNADLALTGQGFDAAPAVFVVLGTGEPLDGIDLGDPGANVREIDLPSDDAPESVEDGIATAGIRAAGDVDGDEKGDLVVGDPAAAGGDGRAWIVFGKGDGQLSLDAVGSTSDAIEISGDTGAALGGRVADAGDVNHDGFDDVIVGASASGDGAGAAYVVYGSEIPDDVDVSQLGDDGFAIATDQSTASLGSVVALAGDVNKDGKDDVLVTAPRSSPQGRTGAGAAYVVLGGEGDRPDVSVDDLGSDGYEIDGAAEAGNEQAPGGLGSSAANVGDVNGDGVPDLALGSPGAASGGLAYLVAGSADTATVDLADPGERAMAIAGPSFARSGPMPIGGGFDLNGDGTADALMAPAGDSAGPDAAYAVAGKP
jgi:hypothetical protein